MEGQLFVDSNSNNFYYSPKTGRIVSLPPEVDIDSIDTNEDFRFNFGYDKNQLRKVLDSNLECLVLEGTQDCNLRCGYCIYGGAYEGERSHQPFDMDIEVARKAVSYFLKHSKDTRPLRAISFYGGEPLMNFEIIKQITAEFNDEKRAFFSISTNGVLLEKYADEIRELGLSIAISLDGPEEVHDKNRVTSNGSPTHAKIMRGVEKLGEDYLKKISFSATITDSADFEKSYLYFRDNFPNNGARLEFVKAYDRVDEEDTDFKIPNETFNIMLDDYKTGIREGNMPGILRFIFDDSFNRIVSRLEEYDGSLLYHNRTCIPGARKLFVNPEGDFFVCEKLGHDQFKIGNVENGIDLQRAYKIMDEITDVANEYCGECNFAQICNVCIPVSGLSCGEFSEDRLSINCDRKKDSMSRYLGLYTELNEELGVKLKEHLLG